MSEYTCLYMLYNFLNGLLCGGQADSSSTTGYVQLDISLLKPSKLEFVRDPAPFCLCQNIKDKW